MAQQQEDVREIEYYDSEARGLITVQLTERQATLVRAYGDTVARLARELTAALTREGMPLRAAENVIADETDDLIESDFHRED